MKPLAAAFPKKDEAGLDFDTIMLDLKSYPSVFQQG